MATLKGFRWRPAGWAALCSTHQVYYDCAYHERVCIALFFLFRAWRKGVLLFSPVHTPLITPFILLAFFHPPSSACAPRIVGKGRRSKGKVNREL